MRTKTISISLAVLLTAAVISFCCEPKIIDISKEKVSQIAKVVDHSWDVHIPGFKSSNEFYAHLTGTAVAPN